MFLHSTYFGVKVTEAFDQDSAETTRKAIQWIKSCDSDKPFFLFIHYIDPHHPYNPPEPFASRFRRDVIGRYDGEIAYVDSNIKKLLEILDSKSLIVITADHGEGLMQRDNFMLHARHIYDEGVRVPLIFYGPNHIKKGLRFSEPVDFLTIAPTIVDLADIEPCHSFAGKSLKRCACDGQPPDANHPIYLMSIHLGRKKFGIRLGHWKYILNQGGEQELFNLIDDPKELSNVVAIFPERASMLATRLKEWKRLYKGPRPKPPVLSDEDRRKFESLGYLR